MNNEEARTKLPDELLNQLDAQEADEDEVQLFFSKFMPVVFFKFEKIRNITQE